MSKEYKYIESILSVEEPNYPEYIPLIGEEGLPVLNEMAQGQDIGLATKAVYMAGFFKSNKALPLIERAVARKNDLINIAAAATLPNLPNTFGKKKISNQLIRYPEPSVQKLMLLSIPSGSYIRPGFKKEVKKIARSSPYTFLRDLANKTLENAKTGVFAHLGNTIKLAFNSIKYRFT